ncbi:hypothetical protein [Halorussus aquaticus]|uniref:Tat (Twin-arginine translocation) pathway signal sequence n=1 Tax=Halorussus aquaticus TaxID=2953748 RepID=A0ABD5Q529_9EURY|nr:hypothetical protein [Halorussus aquaticus]
MRGTTGDDASDSNRNDRLSMDRRRLLQTAGVGIGGLSLAGFGGEVATARTDCADGPFERTYAGATVNLGQIRSEQARGETPGSVAASSPGGDETATDLRRAASDGEGRQPPRRAAQESNVEDPGPLGVRTEYDGVNASETRGGVPSDSQVAAGNGKVLHALNRQVAIFNKQAGRREHQFPLERLWEPVITEPEGGFVYGAPFVFDPRARYDRESDRFVVAATQYEPGLTTDGEVIDRETLEEGELEDVQVSRPPRGWWVVAVSATGNPNGDWHVYRIPPIRNEGLVDYPTLGLDRDAVYLAQNFFGDVFEVTMVALDKAAMYAGGDVTGNHFTGMSDPDADGQTFTVQPALQPLSGGSSGTYYLVNSDFPTPSSGTLTLWELTDPVGDPTLECFTLDVDPYSYPPAARQKGGDETDYVDTLGTRLMNADFEDGSLWTAHTIQYDWDGDGRAVAAIRWYEIDVASRSVVQSGVYGEPGISYYIPTVGADDGTAVISHNVSGPDTYIQSVVAGRTEDFPAGQLEDALVVQEGASNYDFGEGFGTVANPLRWGDYNGVSVDPQSGRFWTVSQYSPETEIPPEAEERDPYNTRIAEVSFDGGN